MSAGTSDPAVEYWTTAMASVREEEHRRRGVVLPVALDRKSTRLNSSHTDISRMPSSA